MKKIFVVLSAVAISALLISAAFSTTSGGGGISKGEKYVNFSFPDSISASETVTFHTHQNLAPSWTSDSTNIKVAEFTTYVALDTLRGTRRVKLSTQSYITGGAQIVFDAVRDTTTRSLVIVKSTGNDTLSVVGMKRMALFYTGSKWVPYGSW